MLTFKGFLRESINKDNMPCIQTLWFREKSNKKIKEDVDGLHDRLTKHYDHDDESEHSEHLMNVTNDSAGVNAHLWKKHNKPLTKANKTIEHHVAGVDNALKQKKTPEDMHVYTGIPHHPKHFNKDADIDKHGTTFHHPAYLHTSLDHSTAASFSELDRKHEEHNHKDLHVLKIHVPKGHHGSYVSHVSPYPDQKEFILPRNTKLKIHPNPVKSDHIDTWGKKHTLHTWNASVEKHLDSM